MSSYNPQYDAEEEHIIYLLFRKLEQLREDKIGLDNTLEAESKPHVSCLTRKLAALRENNGSGTTGISISPEARLTFRSPPEPTYLSFETMLETLRQENERLRNRLLSAERNYIRAIHLNDIYREELIDRRRRLGLPVDDLIGHHSEPLSQPVSSATSVNSIIHYPSPGPSRPVTNGVPIPRPASQLCRPTHNNISETSTPFSHSPSSADSPSPFPFSPVVPTNPASYISANTSITSPGSSESWTIHHAMVAPQTLTYPSVPPPSLASSVGSPTMSTLHQNGYSPLEPASRRDSFTRRGSASRVVESANPWISNPSGSTSHRVGLERGGSRVAETGQLAQRSRAGSLKYN